MNSSFSKVRTSIVFFIFCCCYIFILINLYFLQIKKHHYFIQLAESQYQIRIKKTPERALIYDRNNQLLVVNQDSIAAFITPNALKEKNKLEQILACHFPKALEQLQKNSDAQFMYIKRRLSDEQYALLKKNNCADIQFLHEPARYYPHEALSHIIGITDIDNNGLFGIEWLYQQQLAGNSSIFHLEKDARSGYFHFVKQTKHEGSAGSPVHISIDNDLQFLIHEEVKKTVQEFQAQEGAALVIDPATGQMYAMVQFPTADPNNIENLNLELTKNKIATQSYELGSVIKIFLALAAIEEGVVQPDEYIDCENKKVTYVNGVKISTWPHGHGLITFSEVIQYSNNIGAAKVGLRLGPTLYEHYTRLGFGKKTALDWPGEQKGFVNPPHLWTKPSIISLSFGYEISATLLQLAQAFCIIANDGIAVQPTLEINKPLPEYQPACYSKKTIDTIKDILEKTVTSGTARQAALKGYKVMCKTGTANKVIHGIYNTEHNIYTCAGIIEKNSYKRVIVTFINEAQGNNLFASKVAVPLFERIAERLLIHDHIIFEDNYVQSQIVRYYNDPC